MVHLLRSDEELGGNNWIRAARCLLPNTGVASISSSKLTRVANIVLPAKPFASQNQTTVRTLGYATAFLSTVSPNTIAMAR
mgnify:CR=1 FL=1